MEEQKEPHIEESKSVKLRPCPTCHQMYEVKSPWASLWRWPNLNEWITLFMIVMVIFGAWAYKHDVAVCQDYVKNIDYVCAQRGIAANSIVNDTPGLWYGNYSTIEIDNKFDMTYTNYTVNNLNVSGSNETTS
jgi:hypothetical protein